MEAVEDSIHIRNEEKRCKRTSSVRQRERVRPDSLPDHP